jgi:hypothetical protein
MLGSFGSLFWPTLVATIVGGAIVLSLGYLLVDKRLNLKDKADRDAEEESARTATREAVLSVAVGELQWAAARIPDYIEVLTTKDETIPSPGFEVNGWPLISQTPALRTVNAETTEVVLMAYNRLRTFNDRLADLADLTHGPTSTLFHVTVAASIDASGEMAPQVRQIYDQTNALRRTLATALADRLRDAKPHVDTAIDTIEIELGVYKGIPAVQRRFLAGAMADYSAAMTPDSVSTS